MIRILGALSIVVLGATAVLAQNLAIIKERQAIMKKVSDDNKVLGAMAKGEAPFDAAKVSATLTAWDAAGKKYVTLFPDDAKTGEKTRAKAEIWQNKADFEAKMVDFLKVAATTKAATTAEAFKAAYADLGKACDNCHEKYRAPRT
jgi:cytochrome c556